MHPPAHYLYTMSTLPTFFIPHGGGPCFFMDWQPADTWRRMEAWLRAWPASLPEKPKALLVISGHWEAAPVRITAGANPPLIYDYNGFPPHTYELTWPAPGNPALAAKVKSLLNAANIDAELDTTRGFDHGVFIPLKVAFPQAEIPTVQLSLNPNLDPAQHMAIGAALANLRDEGVLIIGSGMSYHNMRGYRWNDNTPIPGADGFDQWLSDAVETDPTRLQHWAQAAGGRAAHPREEHLLPLMVVAGAARGDAGRTIYHDRVMGAPIGAYQFG